MAEQNCPFFVFSFDCIRGVAPLALKHPLKRLKLSDVIFKSNHCLNQKLHNYFHDEIIGLALPLSFEADYPHLQSVLISS